MSDEPIVNLQSSREFLPTRLPIVLQRVEEQIPVVRKYHEPHGFTGR